MQSRILTCVTIGVWSMTALTGCSEAVDVAKQQAKTAETERTEQQTPSNPGALSDEVKKLFGDELETATGKAVGTDVLGGAEKIGIYFSAHWCPPCRAFSPKLVKAYNALKKEGKSFELVFVSSDRSEDAMRDYMRELEMAWYAIPFDSAKRRELAKTYGVRGIPRLVIIDDVGKVLAQNARGDVSQLGAKAYADW